jgi:peptidoglycan pentaglycine glycine transferase (the first glycine)
MESVRRRLAVPRDVEVETVDEPSWNALLAKFSDANIYQTWSYEAIKSGEGNLGHLVVKDETGIIAAAQARTIHLPYVKGGLAYVRWGPLSCPQGRAGGLESFQHGIRALRAEYVERRGFSIRVLPRIHGECNDSARSILEEEGYASRPPTQGLSTIVLDLRPDLDDIYRGLHHKWRYHLNKARRQGLTVVDGEDEDSFIQFEHIYREMMRRKRFQDSVDVTQLKKIQRRLPLELKMRVFLCRVDGDLCAGGVCSSIGERALYLFGATSDRGIKNYSSYLVHWNMLAWARSRGCQSYDLNGIDPVRNAGGYQFKSQLAAGHGREVEFVGVYDAYPSSAMGALVSAVDAARRHVRQVRQALAPSLLRSRND